VENHHLSSENDTIPCADWFDVKGGRVLIRETVLGEGCKGNSAVRVTAISLRVNLNRYRLCEVQHKRMGIRLGWTAVHEHVYRFETLKRYLYVVIITQW
jgi:hypothetical protein